MPPGRPAPGVESKTGGGKRGEAGGDEEGEDAFEAIDKPRFSRNPSIAALSEEHQQALALLQELNQGGSGLKLGSRESSATKERPAKRTAKAAEAASPPRLSEPASPAKSRAGARLAKAVASPRRTVEGLQRIAHAVPSPSGGGGGPKLGLPSPVSTARPVLEDPAASAPLAQADRDAPGDRGPAPTNMTDYSMDFEEDLNTTLASVHGDRLPLNRKLLFGAGGAGRLGADGEAKRAPAPALAEAGRGGEGKAGGVSDDEGERDAADDDDDSGSPLGGAGIPVPLALAGTGTLAGGDVSMLGQSSVDFGGTVHMRPTRGAAASGVDVSLSALGEDLPRHHAGEESKWGGKDADDRDGDDDLARAAAGEAPSFESKLDEEKDGLEADDGAHTDSKLLESPPRPRSPNGGLGGTLREPLTGGTDGTGRLQGSPDSAPNPLDAVGTGPMSAADLLGHAPSPSGSALEKRSTASGHIGDEDEPRVAVSGSVPRSEGGRTPLRLGSEAVGTRSTARRSGRRPRLRDPDTESEARTGTVERPPRSSTRPTGAAARGEYEDFDDYYEDDFDDESELSASVAGSRR